MKVLAYFFSGIANRFAHLVLGRHPRNTVFSFNWSNLRQLRKFMRQAAAKFPDGKSVFVDVGAGQLPYFESVKDKAERYIAVDYDEVLVDSFEDPCIERSVGTAEKLPVDDSTADVVLMNQVLEHVNCPDQSFQEVHRVLKPNGLFIGSVPHISPVHLEPYDFRRYTDLGVRQLLAKHGFEVVELSGSGGVYSCAAFMIAMDWVLSKKKDGKSQSFSSTRAFWLAPLVGSMNILGYAGDRLLPESDRSPANLTWIARRKI
ncbi:MAG: class I SAM-dependent methyltransferase [Planctomycetaceae bacterium]